MTGRKRALRSVFAAGGVVALAALAVAAQDRIATERSDMPGLFGPDVFAQIDRDGDGVVTTEEADAFRAEQFAQADANTDGQVTRDELAAFHRARIEARLLERARRMAEMASARMMTRLDTDGDGQISAEEMTSPEADRMFALVDRDGDGAITRRETRELRHRIRRHREEWPHRLRARHRHPHHERHRRPHRGFEDRPADE
ncbi:MAG: EF-hand domain-containing protein [Pseudomonadota bacterium]